MRIGRKVYVEGLIILSAKGTFTGLARITTDLAYVHSSGAMGNFGSGLTIIPSSGVKTGIGQKIIQGGKFFLSVGALALGN